MKTINYLTLVAQIPLIFSVTVNKGYAESRATASESQKPRMHLSKQRRHQSYIPINNQIQEKNSWNSWTGIYAGMNMGVIFNEIDIKSQHLAFTDSSETCNPYGHFSSFFPGVQLGYSKQFYNNTVLGLEGNLTWNTHQRNSLKCPCPTNSGVADTITIKNHMQTALRGRLGYAWENEANHIMPFITTGISFANLGLAYKNEGTDHYSKNTVQTGWLAGAGIEWALQRNWSVRAEYFFTDYGSIHKKMPDIYGLIDTNGKANAQIHAHSVEVALNYWIND